MNFRLFLLITLFSCIARPEPDWLNKQPNANDYWFGIGIVYKPYKGENIRNEARNSALNEIASQISVDIASSFKKITKENNFHIDELTKSIIDIRIENNLPNIEIIDSYQSKDKFCMLVRLSKVKYYDTIKKKRQNSIRAALGLLRKSETEFNYQSFSLLGQAMNEIIPYIDTPIEIEYPLGSDKIINLYSYIKLKSNEMINRISLIPEKHSIEIKFASSVNRKVKLEAIDNKERIAMGSIPINCFFDIKKMGPTVLTNNNGISIFSISDYNYNIPVQYLNFSLNLDELFVNDHLLNNIQGNVVQSVVKIIPPKVKLIITENNLGDEMENPYIKPIIIDFFTSNFNAKFIEIGDPDLIIKAVINTRVVSNNKNEYGIYQVFGDATISIKDGISGHQIAEKSFNKIQGSDFNSNKEAASQALKKIAQIINREFLNENYNLININN